MQRRLLIATALAAACHAAPVMTPAPTESPGAMVGPAPVAAPVPPPAPPPDDRPLFDRLGGLPAITAVVHELVSRTTTDPRIQDRFFATDAANLERLLVEMVCATTGGPCAYTGRDMHASHAGMQLVDEELAALVEDLTAALDTFEVGAREQGELLGALGSLRPQIVVPPGELRPLDGGKLAAVSTFAAGLGASEAEARRLLDMAVVAGGRGQRSYAEQLFTRAELALGSPRLAALAPTFRDGAPPRVATATVAAADGGAQPSAVCSSDADAPAARPAGASLRGRLQVEGGPVRGLGVIMLTPDRGGKKRTAKHRIVEQRDKQFAPHILAVPVGSTVAFPNFDRVFHNVFSLSKASPFDLGMYPSGEEREVRFDKPGVIRLGCNIHATMAAYIVVVDAPHYVVVGDDGGFEFRSLKPGSYTVRAWSERTAEPVVSRIKIKAGVNEQVFDLAGDVAAGPGPDKFGGPRAAAPTGRP